MNLCFRWKNAPSITNNLNYQAYYHFSKRYQYIEVKWISHWIALADFKNFLSKTGNNILPHWYKRWRSWIGGRERFKTHYIFCSSKHVALSHMLKIPIICNCIDSTGSIGTCLSLVTSMIIRTWNQIKALRVLMGNMLLCPICWKYL